MRQNTISVPAPLLAAVAILASACAPAGPAAPPAATPAAAATPAPTPTPDAKAAIADFYRGKTVSIVVGFAPGGGFDATARLLSRHLPKHIPGGPTVIVQNMEGAGSLVAANHLYNVAKPDGLTVGLFHETQVLNQLQGREGVQFDARKFGWLAGSFSSSVACMVRQDTPFKSWRDVIASKDPVSFAGTGPGSNTDDAPKVLKSATGANTKVVSGYKGSADVRLAVERGDVHGACFSWESVKATAPDWAAGKTVRTLLQFGRRKHADLAAVPLAEEFATSDDGKAFIRLFSAPAQMAKSFVLPPGAARERLAALRAAFAAAYKDPELLEDAKKSKIDIEPLTAEEVEQIIQEVLSTPPEVAKRFAEILK